MAMLKRIGNLEDMVYSAGFLAIAKSHLGRFEESIEASQMALELGDEIGNKRRQSATYVQISLGYSCKGEWKGMIEMSDRAIDIASFTGDVYVAGYSYAMKGLGQFMNGSPDAGLSTMAEGIRINREAGAKLGETTLSGWFAECNALSGRRDAVESLRNGSG